MCVVLQYTFDEHEEIQHTLVGERRIDRRTTFPRTKPLGMDVRMGRVFVRSRRIRIQRFDRVRHIRVETIQFQPNLKPTRRLRQTPRPDFP